MSDSTDSNHILLSVLIEYHAMGFKVIPICDDGIIPNVAGILTPTEQQNSIEESKNGKVEPVNYIYNHPEFWTEERIRKEEYRFNNVATTLGKTYQDGNPLYRNALDIDSDQVFTILSRLINNDGDVFYFIDKARKLTFVSRTKKRFGRHIFWLSNKQHKSIGTMECKSGSEFEIKTDNSQGLITLPPSRHREDREFHYQSIGLNKIERLDKMYDSLIDTLNDCLKPTNRNTKYDTREKANNQFRVILNDEQINSIYQLVSIYYKTGYRHHITYGLSGLLHRYNISRVIDFANPKTVDQ